MTISTANIQASWFLILGLLSGLPAQAAEYDPLSVAESSQAESIQLTVQDDARNRQIPLKVYLPAPGSTQPVVLFSHGLGGSREGCSYLGRHWAARGYVAVFLQHPGSDDSVWKNQPLGQRMAAMKKAASLQNFLLRVSDVPVVLDQLARWNAQSDHVLEKRLDLARIGMSGHSFGARTTQALSGESAAIGGARFTDSRIKAAVIFSPSSPRRGDPKAAFESVKIPWLLMTGTKDTAPIGGQTLKSRLAVYPALPSGDKYEVVLHNAEHSAFGDRRLPGDTQRRNPNHHRAILALSTAFWDAYLRRDPEATSWLQGPAPGKVLQDQDRWQKK